MKGIIFHSKLISIAIENWYCLTVKYRPYWNENSFVFYAKQLGELGETRTVRWQRSCWIWMSKTRLSRMTKNRRCCIGTSLVATQLECHFHWAIANLSQSLTDENVRFIRRHQSFHNFNLFFVAVRLVIPPFDHYGVVVCAVENTFRNIVYSAATNCN